MELLNKLFQGAVISKAVYEEAVSRGAEKGHDDAHVIAKAIEEGWIRVHKTSRQFTEKVKAEESRLGIEPGEGERETIALAMEKGIPTFLTDDEDAHRVGKRLGLDPKGTLHVLLEGVKKGYLSRSRASEHLSQMLEEGFWLSPTIVHNFHETLGKL